MDYGNDPDGLNDVESPPSVVEAPKVGVIAFAGPLVGLAALVAALISPVAVALVAGAGAGIAGVDMIKCLESRAVLVPKAVVLLALVALPLAAYWGLAPLLIATTAALSVTFAWGLRHPKEGGLTDSLAGSAFAVGVVGFGMAHLSLIATGEFKGGAARGLLVATLIMLIVNIGAAGFFSVAQASVPGAGRGESMALVATLVVAMGAAIIKRPPVDVLRWIALAVAVSLAATAARSLATLLLEGGRDPKEIVVPALAGEGFALRTVGIGSLVFPAAYYVGRWLFV